MQIQKDETFSNQEQHSYQKALHPKIQSKPINRATPLVFGLKMDSSCLISYHKNQYIPHLIRSIVWLAFNMALIFMIYSFDNLSEGIKIVFAGGLILQIILYLLLSFLDPGTLFEDEQENLDQERVFCLVCSVYRLRSTKHCIFCNRCIKKYDHHCGVFGKCIGKRNICLFWVFIILVGVELPSLIILICLNYFLKEPK